MKALILCAGKGTRLGYKSTPKCMAKVNGKPILEHLVNHLNKAGVSEIIVNISDHSDYTKIFKYFGTRLLYFYEPILMGEAGTELALSKWLGDKYIVMNGDTLTNVDIDKLTENYSKSFSQNFSRYSGTKYVNKITPTGCEITWSGNGAYYFDIGTPAKLAKARRFFKNHG